MEPEELVGRQFTIAGYPGVYTITEYLIDMFCLSHTETVKSLSIHVAVLMDAIKDGTKMRLIPIAETSTEDKPVQQEPEQTNYFSFDDL